MPPLIATRPPKSKLSQILASTLVHITDLDRLPSIVVDTKPASTKIGENCTVHLQAGQGWSVAPFRLFRDYSVLDVDFGNLRSWGRYLYFFVGEPSWWAILKNLDSLRKWEDLQAMYGVIRVSGAQLLSKSGQPVFHRPDDDAVIIRGDYNGPALVSPAPKSSQQPR